MKKILDVYKKLSWKIKYDAWDMPYPPVLFWKKNISFDDSLKSWKNTLEKYYHENHNMWLYVHMPFCYTKCHYCTCFIKVSHKEEEYDKYIDNIEKEAKKYSETFKWKKFNTVYIWWWTPTILTAKQIDRFYKILHKYFDLSDAKQIMTEWSPYTTTREKLDILVKNWVNKMTFGVQSLDEEVLNMNNRPQDSYKIWDLLKDAREAWVNFINIDLMVWIPWQTIKSLDNTVDFVKNELKPDTVHVNPFWPTKKTTFDTQKWFYSIEDINKRNKMNSLIHYLQEESHNWSPLMADNLQEYNSKNYNSSILWLWVWAISHSFWNLHYTKKSFSDYYSWLDWKSDISLTWFKIGINDEIIAFLINNFRTGIYFLDFKVLFNIDIEDTSIYNKLLYLIKIKVLILKDSERWKVLISKLDSWLYSSVYSKYLYNDDILKDYIKNYNINSFEYSNLELKLKQFFVD